MAILVTGVPGSGKSGLARRTRIFYQKVVGRPLGYFSFGDEFIARLELEEFDPINSPYMDHIVRQAYRTRINHSCALSLARQRAMNGIREAIIEGPLYERSADGTFEETIPLNGLGALRGNPPELSIDRIINVIEDPRKVLRRLRSKGQMEEIEDDRAVEQILQWISQEATRSQDFSQHYTPYAHPLIIPRDSSSTTPLKVLLDPTAPVVYLAYPITHTRGNHEARRLVEEFEAELQKYCILKSPILLADEGATDIEEVHTRRRDLNWFIPGSDMVIAYYPADVKSTGVATEIERAITFGKKVILIHPNPDNSTFGKRVRHKFRTTEEFLGYVRRSREVGDKQLQRLLSEKKETPNDPRFGEVMDKVSGFTEAYLDDTEQDRLEGLHLNL